MSVNTTINIKGETIDFRCLLELLVVNVDLKPTLLTLVEITETYINTALSALEISLLPLQQALEVLESAIVLFENFTETIISQYSSITNIAGGIPCTSLDFVLAPATDFINQKLRIPSKELKQRYIDTKNQINVILDKISLLELSQTLFQELRNQIDNIPSISVGAGSSVTSTKTLLAKFTGKDGFDFSNFEVNNPALSGSTSQGAAEAAQAAGIAAAASIASSVGGGT